MSKADLFNVEQTVTVHKCFYWLFVHLHIKTFSVLCTVEANKGRNIRSQGREWAVTKQKSGKAN